MNEARNAVKNCRKDAFCDMKKLASAKAQRSMLGHLADICRWSCELRAMLANEEAPRSCDHKKCTWMCYETESETAETLLTDESSVRRTRTALVRARWVEAEKTSTGRGAVWFFRIERDRVLASGRDRGESRRVKLPSFFDRLAQRKVHLASEPCTEKVGTVPTFRGKEGRHREHLYDTADEKGRHGAQERCSPCTEKVGTVPEKGRHGAQNSDCYKEERIEHKNVEKHAQPVIDVVERMAPEMVAKQVQLDLGISSPKVWIALTDQCRIEQASGKADADITDQLVEAYREYDKAKSDQKLKFPWGPESFFADAHWRKPSGWPWKEGCGPKPKAPAANSSGDLIQQQIEREKLEFAEAEAERQAEREKRKLTGVA